MKALKSLVIITTRLRWLSSPANPVSSSTRRGGLSSSLRFAAAALLLPQLPTLIWCLHTRSFLYVRGWVNLEYLMVLALVVVFPNWGTLTLATLEMCLALVEPLAHLYYFHFGDVVSSLRYLIFLPVPRLLGYAGLLFLYAAVTLIALRWLLGVRPHQCAKQIVCSLAVFGVLATGADAVQGRFARYVGGESNWRGADVGSPKIIRMPIASLAYPYLSFARKGHAAPNSLRPLPSALSQAMAKVPAGDLPDVVLVLTESWGLATDRRITDAQMQAYQNPVLNHLYSVQTGHVRFDGSTTSGETRELCGNSAGSASIAYPESYFAGCWPTKFNREGYDTLAVHGFAPAMYRREDWYHRFGFDEEVFRHELQLAGAATCGGAFPGICDDDVARWIGKSLLAGRDQRPRFVHWVTLNSHLPIPAMDGSSPEHDCVAIGIAQNQSLCAWFLLVQRVHESVARLAATSGLRPTVFVVVGDHAPPFMRPSLRDQFSQTDVPYVVLVPRSFRPRSMAGVYSTDSTLH